MWTPHRQAWGGSALGSGGLGLRRRTGKAKPTARRPSTPRPPGGCMEHARARGACSPLLPPCGGCAGTRAAPHASTAQQPVGGAGVRAAGEEAEPGYLGGGHRDLGTHPHCSQVTPCRPLGTPGQPHARGSPTLRRPPAHTGAHTIQGQPGRPGRAARSRGQRQALGAHIMATDLALLTPTQAHGAPNHQQHKERPGATLRPQGQPGLRPG